jgi:hypothetical protein
VRRQLADPKEYKADQFARPLIEQAALRPAGPHRERDLQGLGRRVVKRDHTLPTCLAVWNPQARGAVRIPVEAVRRQSPYLAPPRPGPPSASLEAGDGPVFGDVSVAIPFIHEQQRRALVRTAQCTDRIHESCELARRNVPRHAVRSSREIPMRYKRPTRHLSPAPGFRVVKELSETNHAAALPEPHWIDTVATTLCPEPTSAKRGGSLSEPVSGTGIPC